MYSTFLNYTLVSKYPFITRAWGKKEWSLAVFVADGIKRLVPADVTVTSSVAELLVYAIELDDPTQYDMLDTMGPAPAKFTDHVVRALQCGALKVLKKIIGDDVKSFRAAWPNTAKADNILHVALNDRPRYSGRYYRPALHRESVQYILTQLPIPYTASILAEIAYLQDKELLRHADGVAWVGAFREILEKGRASIPGQETCEKPSASSMIVRNKFYDDALFFLLDTVLGSCAYILLMEYGCSTEAMFRVHGAEVSSILYVDAANAAEHLRVPYLVTLFDLGCPVDPQFLKAKKYSECATPLWLHMGRAMGVPDVDQLQEPPKPIITDVHSYLAGVNTITGDDDGLASCEWNDDDDDDDNDDELLSDE